MHRRNLLKLSLVALAGLLNRPALANIVATPAQSEGPFYPERPQADTDIDLTQVAGHTQRATGRVVQIHGRVTRLDGQPLANATVEIWQANHYGRYAHSRDSNPAQLDEHFQGWGITTTNTNGEYRFTTIMPGAYPASRDWVRPPHIHYRVSHPRHTSLTTQMYFPGESLNKHDLILNGLSPREQQQVIARASTENRLQFDITLA